MSRICRTCSEEKEKKEFHVGRASCKNCTNRIEREKYNSNKEKTLVRCRKYYKNNKEKKAEYHFRNREKNLLEFRIRGKQRRDENSEILWQFLLDHPCIVCGEEDPVKLEFDHLDNQKKNFNVGEGRNLNSSKVIEEISKCQILCSNCHKRKTIKDRNWYFWMGETAAEDDLSNPKNKCHRITSRRLFDFKCSSQCVDCGEADPFVLEFDHVRGEKLFNLGHAPGRKWDRVVTEVAKCEIRCGNCHRAKTSERKMVPRE